MMSLFRRHWHSGAEGGTAIGMGKQVYKVKVLTGRQNEAALRFYQQAGFEAGIKMGLIAKP
jgi:hypothetical protein